MSDMALFLLILLAIVAALLVTAQTIANKQGETFVLDRHQAARETSELVSRSTAMPGRHRTDTAEFHRVDPDWTPHIGRRAIAAQTSTQRILPPAKETH